MDILSITILDAHSCYTKCCIFYCYDETRSAECHTAESSYDECHSAESRYVDCRYSECRSCESHSAQNCYFERCYAEFHYTGCRSCQSHSSKIVILSVVLLNPVIPSVLMMSVIMPYRETFYAKTL